MDSRDIVSSFQLREPLITKCEVNNYRVPHPNEKVELNTSLTHDIKLQENDHEFWYGTVFLLTICKAVPPDIGINESELCKVEFSVECTIRSKKEAIERDKFLEQFELIGLNTLISTTRATIRGLLGMLKIEFPFAFPLMDLQKMIKLRKEMELINEE